MRKTKSKLSWTLARVLVGSLLLSIVSYYFYNRYVTVDAYNTKEAVSQTTCIPNILPGSPTGYWSLDEHGFKGVFQFLGQDNPKNAAKSNIAGANLEWSWAEVEPAEGHYNWGLVDNDINAWTSHGKPVILRFATGGQNRWSGSVNNSFTPSWLFNSYKVPRVTETNGTVFPLYWNTTYLQKLTNFVNAAAARYDTNPQILGVQIGVGQGGETEPDGIASNNSNQLGLWQRYGYTNALWWQTLKNVVSIYKSAWKHTPLTLMTTSTFLQANDKTYNRSLVEEYAVKQGLWLQINSLHEDTPSSILVHNVGKLTTTIEEQKQPAYTSGYPAINDVKRGMTLGARYVLVFARDINRSKNDSALTYAMKKITSSVFNDCANSALKLTATGRVSPAPGVMNTSNTYSQFFDGITGTISGGVAPIKEQTTWSLEGWLYPTVLPQNGAIAIMNGSDGNNGGGEGFGIAGANGGQGSQLVAYLPRVGWIDSGYTFPATRTWYHVAVTRDGNTITFYVNGHKTPNTSTAKPEPPSTHFSIGSGYDSSSSKPAYFFSGAVDEVAAYQASLTSSQIQTYYTRVQRLNSK